MTEMHDNRNIVYLICMYIEHVYVCQINNVSVYP